MVSVALLAACTTGGQPSTSALTSPPSAVPSSAATTRTPVSTPPPLVIPRPTVPFVRCDTKDLEMQLISLNGALSNELAIVELRNKSSHDCDLFGYADLQLLDARNRPLPTHVNWSRESYFGTAPAPAIVGLPAGTAEISPDRPIPGHAYIPIIWGESAEQCVKVAQFGITPPSATTSIVVSVSATSPASEYVLICLGGSVTINPTVTIKP